MNKNIPVLHMEHVAKTYYQGDEALHVLNDIHLTLSKGEVVAMVGPSGSGKSTLLQIMGLLDRMDQGRILLNAEPCHHLHDQSRTLMRRKHIGFVYQMHHLLPDFTAIENVAIPLLIDGVKESIAMKKARTLLKQFGLEKRLFHRPSELSGGEQQRVAIARSMIHEPALLLADEPTGNLDTHTANNVFELLLKTIHTQKMASMIVTHNMELARRADRIVTLEDGKIKPYE